MRVKCTFHYINIYCFFRAFFLKPRMFKRTFAFMWRDFMCWSQSDPGCSKRLTLHDSLAVCAALCLARREVSCCSASQDVSASYDWTRQPQAHSQSLFSPLSPIATAVWLVQVLQGEEWVNGERRDREKGRLTPSTDSEGERSMTHSCL